MTDVDAKNTLIPVLGFNYFYWKAYSMKDRADHLLGSILEGKYNMNDLIDAAKLFKEAKEKEEAKVNILNLESVKDN